MRADGVGVSFGDRRVFADLSLTVSPGQRIGLLDHAVGEAPRLRRRGVDHLAERE